MMDRGKAVKAASLFVRRHLSSTIKATNYSVVRQIPQTAIPEKSQVQIENANSHKIRRSILKMSHPVDVSLEGIRNWAKRRAWEDHVRRYSFDVEMMAGLGPELAAAYFFVARGGAVKFSTSPRWYSLGGESLGVTARSQDQLLTVMPQTMLPGQAVEAVVLRGLPLIYESFRALSGCQNLRYLDMSNCPHVDDWCLQKLHFCYHSLRYLNISGCEKVTDRGVSSLFMLQNLRRLVMLDLPRITDNKSFMLSLETALPHCLISPAVSFDDSSSSSEGDEPVQIIIDNQPTSSSDFVESNKPRTNNNVSHN